MEIKAELASLGISGTLYKRGREMKIVCPFHDDHKPSMSIRLTDGNWFCYAQCGGGDWMEFVERIKKDGHYAPLSEITTALPSKPKTPVLKSLLNRGFTREILEKWSIEWDAKVGAMHIPIYSRSGNKEGSIWRFPEGIEPKYRYEQGFQRSNTLYGLWRLPEMKGKPLVLVEGPLDAIWVQEHAQLPALAILGSSLSDTQISIILREKPSRVILCFDNDPAGNIASSKAANQLRNEGAWIYSVKMPLKYKDIQEVPHDKVATVLKNQELYHRGKGIVHPRYKRWDGKTAEKTGGIWRRG